MFKHTTQRTLKNEQETRALVAFIENVAEIKAAIAELDAIRAAARIAEDAAYEAVKAAELKEQIVGTKEQAADRLVQANVEALQRAQVAIDRANEVEKVYACKGAAMKMWEDEAEKKEADYNLKFAAIVAKHNDCTARENAVVAREKALQAQLDAFKAV